MTLEKTPEAIKALKGATKAIEPPVNGAAMDPFDDDEPIACGIENPEVCESCQ